MKRKGTLEGPITDASGRRYWRGKVRLQDGTRVRIDIPEARRFDEPAARQHVEWAQEDEDQRHTIYKAKMGKVAAAEAAIIDAAGETCDAWYKRYHAHQVELGRSAAKDARSAWNAWISPKLGTKPLVTVTRDNIEDVRDVLDAAILQWKVHGRGPARISGKRAMNIWSALTSAFKAAAGSKRRDLRVLEGRPNRNSSPRPVVTAA